jgi:hypothetical protein
MHANKYSNGQTWSQVRHPIVSCVLFLTSGHVGGPTLVTPQLRTDRTLANHGWLVHPTVNRLTVFNGSVLHGVIPGHGVLEAPAGRYASQESSTRSCSAVVPAFRVTFMVAFWDDIHIRPGIRQGAARPFPLLSDEQECVETASRWTSAVRPISLPQTPPSSRTVLPTRVEPVWVAVQGAEASINSSRKSTQQRQKPFQLPPYEKCFQGI